MLDNLPNDYFKRQIILEMKNKLPYIDKIKSTKAKTRVIATLSSEEIRDYIEQKTDEERNVIIKNLPDKLKVKCLYMGGLSEEELKSIVLELKDINAILELSPEHLKLWRQYGDAQVISENIDLLMQKEEILSRDDRHTRIEILSRMYQKNDRVYNTINFDLLNEQYINLFGEDRINQFASFLRQQEMLLALGNRGDLGLDILARCIKEHNDESTWTQLADELLKYLTSNEYEELLASIKSLEDIDIKKLSAILQQSNVFEISKVEDIENFDSIREEKCEEWIKSEDISKKKLAVLEKIFGQDLNGTYAILTKYSTDIEAISDENLKDYVKSLQIIYNSNDGALLEKIYAEVKTVELVNQIGIEKELKTEYGKLLNDGLLKIDGNLNQLSELGSNIYDAGTDFKIIMTSVGAFVEQKKNRTNYYEDWNRADIACQHMCTSYIRNDMMGTAPINNICYGFSEMAEGSLIMRRYRRYYIYNK